MGFLSDLFSSGAKQSDLEKSLGGLGQTSANALQGPAAGLIGQGTDTLGGILGSQGRLPKQLLNEQLAFSGLQNQGTQDFARGEAARAGLEGSPVALALQTAIKNAGAQQTQGILNKDIQDAEARKRSDLGLLLSMIIGPSLGGANTAAGLEAGRLSADTAIGDRLFQALGLAVGGAPSIIGAIKKD